MRLTKHSRVIGCSRGNAVIEFALVLPILLLVLFGITEFGRLLMTTNILNTASREGARLAAVSPAADSLNVRARVTQVLTAAKITPKAITIEFLPATTSVRVTVTTDFHVLSKSVLPPSMRGTFELRAQTVFRSET